MLFYPQDENAVVLLDIKGTEMGDIVDNILTGMVDAGKLSSDSLTEARKAVLGTTLTTMTSTVGILTNMPVAVFSVILCNPYTPSC